MTTIDHAALWVADLEAAKDFYASWFGGVPNELYHNPRTGLRTYILSFGDGARLELMTRPDVAGQGQGDRLGWAHVSFAVPDRAAVDAMAQRLGEAGVEVVDGPRQTGDGYYEIALLDPEGNRVEVVAAYR
ncbi:VOC family protein [Actinomyces slackii]|uniref:Predicted enzyme related to lactoylglutathione lyase n=1 Tax=Actinomyces slackii TaxID=52774 RepID=A0A448KCN2_9ACTO|nr:VOC family protein [Actinomyces slackii]VEG74640.1 Predicted enzyme related to lactoylglutathione lyase [Actinomyces slackii]